jgi:signal transduction histidine kinase/ligand-binding sensor domain-containing protein/DNA-binding response OmpR family regulator
MKQLHSFILLLFLICPALLRGQTTRFHSTEQGLSSSLINHVYQDKKGYIWIATEDGLNCFDGTRFVTYRMVEGDSTSLKNNYVRSLFEDSAGRFYVGCIDGLMQYDRATDRFREIPVAGSGGVRVFPHITCMIERSNGDLWIATSGLGLFSLKKGESVCRSETELNRRVNNLFLTAIYEDSHGQLWIGSEHAGWLMSDSGKVITPFNTNISSFCEDDAGNVFIGMLYDGLLRYSLETGAMSHVPDPAGKTRFPVKTLLTGRSGQIYVGTDGQGMKRYNATANLLERYEPASTPFDFSKAKVHCLIEDKDGNIWAGIFQKGLFFISGNPNGFRYYGYKSFQHNNIGSNSVMAVQGAKNGLLWIGTDNDGLYSLDEKTQRVRHYEQSTPATILCIRERKNGQLWLGSYLNGLSLFDPRTGRCTYFNQPKNEILPPNRVYCLQEDGKGNLWIGSYGDGLYKFDVASQTLTEHYLEDETASGLANNWINYLFCDDKGLLWIATYKGLSCFDPDDRTFTSYTRDNSPLPGNVIFTLKEDSNHQLWIGTDNGLACMDKSSKQIRIFNTDDGLGGKMVCAIEPDDQNRIWLSTHSGISMYSPDENRFAHYYTSDGLQGTEYMRSASFKTADGAIFFGGINGVTTFYPADIHDKRQALNVFLTNFYLSGKPVFFGQKSGKREIFNRPLADVPDISLAARDNAFSMEFSTFDYSNPEGISYYYRLEDFDNEWIENPPGNNRITYTNLSHGKYRLHFYASDKENRSPEKVIAITVRPAWYQTIWMKGIYFVLVLLSAYAVYLYIRSKIRHRNEILRMEHAEQISEAKLQFFTNISHEIRTPMTLILGPLEKLLHTNRDPETQQSYWLIYRNAQRILRLINQLMDMRKIDRGQMKLRARETDLVDFVEDVMKSFDYSAKKKNILFRFHHEPTELKAWIDRNNFDKILFNILSNAFKFTPDNGEIDVYLAQNNSSFEIKIIDSGIGLKEEDMERIFDRFYQVATEERMSNYGTGIGLHLTRSLVDLHHGTIHATARPDRSGAVFVVTAPLGNAHLTVDEIETVPSSPLPEKPVEIHADPPIETEKETETPDSDASKTKTRYRILIVEDDKDINHYIRNELRAQYRIRQAYDGKEALEYILKEKPDLIITDLMMPGMDGINLSKKVKTNINTEHIPIIILTAKSLEEDQIQSLETGADAFITKPFNTEILKTTITNLLLNRERLKGKFHSQSGDKIEDIQLRSANDQLMDRIMRIINENIDNPDLTVEMLSTQVGMSRVHLHRKLKELTNQSSLNFIRNIRLSQAARLMRRKDLSISDVAYAVGFSTLSHFSSSFKEFYGTSPKEYMENLE